jgi:hypothetical protein
MAKERRGSRCPTADDFASDARIPAGLASVVKT